MKIQLIQPPIKESYTGVAVSGQYPPLGLLSIATYLKNQNPKLETEILDGEIETLDSILSKTDGDIVGISAHGFLSYENGLIIAKKAKENGAITVMGGGHATIIADRIVRNRDFVDYVVLQDGEKTFSNIVEGRKLQEIKNLCYRSGEEIKTSPIELPNLNDLPIPDRSLIDQNPYFKNFEGSLESRITGLKRATSIYSQKGCGKAVKYGKCTFCVRPDVRKENYRLKVPKKFWEEVEQLVKNQDIDYFWDISASFPAKKEYVFELSKTKPSRIKPSFLIYGRADEVCDEETVRALNNIGIRKILIGFESGNQRCLDLSNKRTTIEQNIEATKLLAKYGITIYGSFVPGLIGETYESLNETLEHARTLAKFGNIETMTCSLLMPLPGNYEFNVLIKSNPELARRYEEIDVLDIDELRKSWFGYLGLDVKNVEKIAEEIRRLAPIKSGHGRKKQQRND